VCVCVCVCVCEAVCMCVACVDDSSWHVMIHSRCLPPSPSVLAHDVAAVLIKGRRKRAQLGAALSQVQQGCLLLLHDAAAAAAAACCCCCACLMPPVPALLRTPAAAAAPSPPPPLPRRTSTAPPPHWSGRDKRARAGTCGCSCEGLLACAT